MESTSSHSLAWEMLMNVAEFLDSVPYNVTDSLSVSEWASETYQLWKTLTTHMSKNEYLYGTTILLGILDQYLQFGKEEKKEQKSNLEKRQEAIERIRSAPQIEQRTENWYKESLEILSGSQYATILKPGRTRGQLVLEKAGITKRETGGATVVLTPYLNPFMWGIRFEPLVKQVYQALTGTDVVELGRLRHSTNKRLGASPDGLVVSQMDEEQKKQDRVGRFVEFKAPVTRPIYNKVPEEYKVQMQIQMEVGNVEECDYLEVKFISLYKNISASSAPSLDSLESVDPVYQGNIFILELQEKDNQLRYEYSPLNDMEWRPILQTDEQLLETIPWYTNEWYLTTIPRSREWYESVKSKEDEFWKDVEGAKEGTWKLPESTRKPKEKVAKYAFVDSENENPS